MTAGYPAPDEFPADAPRFPVAPPRPVILPDPPPVNVRLGWGSAFRIAVAVAVVQLLLVGLGVAALGLAAASVFNDVDTSCNPVNAAGEPVYCP